MATQVFTINDINLRIAPEAISVQKEDLVYNWKTLRTKASTKIPSGHGQMMIQVRIPFMDSQILALHRLIVEFRQSPFCSIENIWLRQTLCPEWPTGQKMAFTMTGFDVVPYPGTANAWIVNLELIWFNYFPYVHNWLYRRDWTTEWQSSKTSRGEPYYIKTTIGWDINAKGERLGNRINVIDSKSAIEGDEISHQEWSAINEQYLGKEQTIQDMELLHRGEIFDLLPIPAMMEKAFFVPHATDSLIYKRFINFLQRDALLKNFNIDLEALVGPVIPQEPLQALLFTKLVGADTFDNDGISLDGAADGKSDYVQAIHEHALPAGLAQTHPGLQDEWSKIYDGMTAEILKFKEGVEFSFATYKAVQLPNKIAQATQAIMKKAKAATQPLSPQGDNGAFVYGESSKRRVRRGLSDPLGFYLPIGFKDSERRTFKQFNAEIHNALYWRSKEELKRLYPQTDPKHGRYHWGMDISDSTIWGKTPIRAVKGGIVYLVRDDHWSGVGEHCIWKTFIFTGGVLTQSRLPASGDIYDDWVLSCNNFLGGATGADVGTILKSITDPTRFYFVDFGDGGQQVTIDHNGGRERSKYLHLSKIIVKPGQPVIAGQTIGYIGDTSPLINDELAKVITGSKAEFKARKKMYLDPIPEGHTTLHSHLHFEYYELSSWDPQMKDGDANADSVPLEESSFDSGYVAVDIRPTCKWAEEQGFDDHIDSIPETDATVEAVKALVGDSSDLTEDDKAELLAALDSLYTQGYFYYDRQEDVTNIWWRPWKITVQSVNEEFANYDQIIQTDTAVLTNMTAGLRHIVASIPILGHEFPTHQHLGSIEPYYNLEFHLLDDSNTLEGIGEKGGILTAMRFLLQHNARKFRLIPDSWCLLTNCFLTRLIGTLQESDRLVAAEEGEAIGDFVLNRRTIISRAQIETIEGNPGLSRLQWELQETNPYTTEALEINAPTKTSVESARQQVLEKLNNFGFVDKYKDLAVKLLIAQTAKANTSSPGESNFGQFSTYKITNGQLSDGVGYLTSDIYSNDNDGFAGIGKEGSVVEQQLLIDTYDKIRNSSGSHRAYVLKDDNQTMFTSLRAAGIPVETINKVGVGQWVVIPESVVGLNASESQKTADQYGETTLYNIRDLLIGSQETLLLGEIPIVKIQFLMSMLKKIMLTAEMYLAEEKNQIIDTKIGAVDGSPLPLSKIRDELYRLPVQPKMLRTFQYYLEQVAASCYYPNLIGFDIGVSPDNFSNTPSQVLSNLERVDRVLRTNPTWLEFNEDTLDPSLLEINGVGLPEAAAAAFTIGVNLATPIFSAGLSGASRLWGAMHNGQRLLAHPEGLASGPEGDLGPNVLHSYWADYYNAATQNIAEQITRLYVNQLPLVTLAASEWVKDIAEDSIFGALATNLVGDSGNPAIANTRTALTKAVRSSGHFGPHPWSEKIPFFLENDTSLTTTVEDLQLDNDGQPISQNITSTSPSLEYKVKPISYSQALFEQEGLNIFVSDKTLVAESGVPLPGSPFKWLIESSVEAEKVAFLKKHLATLADEALADPLILRAYGLEALSSLDRGQLAKGKAAYPDLDLPYHPYYGDLYSVSPDFYMWNMYEDGDVFNSTVRQSVSNSMNKVLENCYESLQVQQEGKKFSPKTNKASQDVDFDSPLNVKFNAEGTDGSSKNAMSVGPTAHPYYPTDESDSAIAAFFQKSTDANEKTQRDVVRSSSTDDKRSASTNLAAEASSAHNSNLDAKTISGIKTSATEGIYGAGAGVQYPSRLSEEQYTTLKNQVDSITTMFGSRAGYLNQKELPSDAQDRLDGTPLERPKQPSHEYDLEALKLLAENSSNDLFSQKRRLARAFPTFKLYFIEEDEFESRLLNFDDFYSYNAVKDFSVTMSRKSPGDVAIITLQNVSGVLDGTKRDAVADLDYYTQKPQQKKLAGDPVLKGTDQDQPFGSLVLRPGMNVQLRCGYSNDPDNLTVLINGRVVDVQWNQQGDNAQIMVQSFGTELLQVLKGTNAAEEETYYTTHQLLGALLLEPELVHFGRWEIGQLFQTGENKDSTFDFYDYAKEANFGVFNNSTGAVKWLFSHPIVLAGLALGGIAVASRIPGANRLFAPASRWGTRFTFVNNFLAKLGILGGESSAVLSKDLIKLTAAEAALKPIPYLGVGTVVTAESEVTTAVLRTAFARRIEQLALRAEAIGTRESSKMFGTELADRIRNRGLQIIQGVSPAERLVPIRSIKNAVEEFTALESYAGTELLKGRYMTNPFSVAKGRDIVSDIGRKPISQILKAPFSGVAKVVGAASLVGAAGDIVANSGLYEATIGRAEKYFAAAKVRIMLSPQDDNIFAPHPKDYMTLGQGWVPQFKRWITYTAVTAIAGSDELGTLANHYFQGNDPFDKRAPVENYEYKLNNTYIWDVLEEMCLRHPGWIYAVRPYGKRFRYTLFFGVPSQRYWSQPADNSFILRANKVAKFLENDITLDEYRSLYGNDKDGLPLEDFDYKLTLEATMESNWNNPTPIMEFEDEIQRSPGSAFTDGTAPLTEEQLDLRDARIRNGIEDSSIKSTGRITSRNDINNKAYTDKLASLRNMHYGSRALVEYLKALNLRFIPLRRYHQVSSEIDLVYNGIIGSENATFNAVDITYFDENAKEGVAGPTASVLVKAHAFMPENTLRVKTVEPYPNCYGYQMGMRYGMGALAFSMRDMYRGELITLGNPRMMPWDFCILMDTYNSMVGPIEIEQIVHTFSNETGFITEIKPSAVVICNETSSWPILEAMKLASLAVRNVENDSLGITAASFGSVGTAINFIVDHGPGGDNPEYQDYAKRKMKDIFGSLWNQSTGSFGAGISPSDVIFNGMDTSARDVMPGKLGIDQVEGAYEESVDTLRNALGGLAIVGAATGLGLAAVTHFPTGFGTKIITKAATATKLSKGIDTAVAAGLFAGSGAVGIFDANFAPPSLMSLLGGSILMLQCLRGDSLMVIPLMKNGYPIAAGLNYHDPSMIWRNFMGELGRYADDVLGGGRDLADLWQIYGMYAWRKLPGKNDIEVDSDMLLLADPGDGGQF